MLQREKYKAPDWASPLQLIPKDRFALGVLPTPVHQWAVPGVPAGCELWVKQDSLSGLELSGNKIRKLEFILADALDKGADCVVTLGGIQSNHARATAVAATMLGLECHLILRNSRTLADSDPGLVGNLLIERMVGAHVHQVSKEEYARVGQQGLALLLEQQLQAQGKRPYVVPVGGSSALGTWGYVDCVAELHQQMGDKDFFTDIVMACGSGATSGGLALGNYLSGSKARVTAYGVCDSPDYFHDYIDGLFQQMGATQDAIGASSRDMLRMVDAKGAGYAISKADELATVQQVALATGIIMDPVYTGKALHGLLRDMQAAPEQWAGRRVLFIHTGGLYGMYDKLSQLQPLLEATGRVHRMQVGDAAVSKQYSGMME